MHTYHKTEVGSQETQASGVMSQSGMTVTHSPKATVTDIELPGFAPPIAPSEIGRLGKYRIQKELGRGGMGAVYLAFDERLQRKVALKVMLPKAAAIPSAKDRFLREARAAAQISSDHVVNIYEADEINNVPYISLQFLQGYPLDEYLKLKGLPTISQCIRIARETAIGLAAAHELGLVHRDIKPGNIWLEAPTGRVKVLDFGLAKPVEGSEDAELTDSGAVVGTPAYMAPEQGLGLPLDGRADLFSLGCTMYRLLTGKLPFEGRTLMAILTALATEVPTSVRQLNPDVPEPLANLIQRLMAKKPEDRPATAMDVADELSRIATQDHLAGSPESMSLTQVPVVYLPLSITLPPNPFADLDITESDEKPEAATELVTPPKKPRRLPTLLVGIISTGFLAIILGGFIVIKITNKDGSITEVKVPSDAKIEINGQTIQHSLLKPPQTNSDPERKAAEFALSLGGTIRVDDLDVSDVANLPKRAFQLTHLYLNDTKVSDKDLVQFKDCKNLTRLRLGNTQVTDAGLIHFKDCKNLIELHLPNIKISDAGLAHFKDCKNLMLIQLTGTEVTDVGLIHFKDCKNLRSLKIDRTKVSDIGLAHFKDCKNLTMLYLSHNRVTDVGMAHFKDCTSLTNLQLRSTLLTDAGIAHFKEYNNLQTLDLSKTQVTDAGLVILKDCKKLTLLDLSETKVTSKFIEELNQALPRCNVNWNGGTTELDRKAAEYALSLGGIVRVDGLGTDIRDSANLPQAAFRLTHLNLSDTMVDDVGLAHFKDCKNLKQLYLYRTQVTDVGLANFKDCKNLTSLHLYSTQVSTTAPVLESR